MCAMAKRKRKKPPGVSPMCSCLVLCDDVVVSHAIAKHNLLGVVGGLVVSGFPGPVQPLVVYVRLSNVHGDEQVKVSFAHADDHDQPLWEFDAQLLNQNDPLSVHTLLTPVPPFRVEKPGRHMLMVRHAGTMIAQVPVHVRGMVTPRESP
jgi:hypothetical protein